MNKSESIIEIAKSLNNFHKEVSAVKKGDENPFFKSKYASLNDILSAIKEPLKKYGLAFSQFPIAETHLLDGITTKKNKKDEYFNLPCKVGYCGVETILMHVSGEYISGTTLLAVSQQDPQAYGSAITYARRYAIQSILGIPTEDDDGNIATHGDSNTFKNENSWNKFENGDTSITPDIAPPQSGDAASVKQIGMIKAKWKGSAQELSDTLAMGISKKEASELISKLLDE